MNEVPEIKQYDVNLPKPRTRKVLFGVLAMVLVIAVVGFAAAAIANRAAQSQGEATAAVMPANTMLYFSMNTHTEKLPNFNVVADAWKDSKEAKMLASGLELAFTQAGLNWEEDIQPWLGDRVAVGLIDFGGRDASAGQSLSYRVPFFVVAVQTKDRAKSDAVLANLAKQLEKSVKSSGGSLETETYRNIAITHAKSGNKFMPESGAFATINDVIVFTLSLDNLKAAINAALDGQNLAVNADYKTVMSALPEQNAGAMYMNFPAYMDQYFKMMSATTQSMEESFDNLYTSVYSHTNATPDPNMQKQMEERKRQREEARKQQDQQLQELRSLMQAMGGVGAVMVYEPTGIRFDMAEQYDPAQMPEKWQKYQLTNPTPASNRIFDSLPNSAIVAVNANLKGSQWGMFLDPDYWAMSFATLPGMTKDKIAAKLAEFQQAMGVNLQTDVLDLINGDAGFAVLLRDQQKSDAMSYSMPIEIAALFDSNDANKLMGSFDKLMQGLSALSHEGGIKVHSLSGLPYSAIMIDDKPVLTYGVVDGRFVIGTDSNTLLGIDNADQAPLSSDATFKQAMGLLPGNRLNTAYVNFQPLWDLIKAQVKGDTSASNGLGAVLNYLGHFKWMSSGTEAPANGLERSSVHIGIAK